MINSSFMQIFTVKMSSFSYFTFFSFSFANEKFKFLITLGRIYTTLLPGAQLTYIYTTFTHAAIVYNISFKYMHIYKYMQSTCIV